MCHYILILDCIKSTLYNKSTLFRGIMHLITCLKVKVRLTVINNADHYSITRDVVAPNGHHVQVKPTGIVLALCKLNTHKHRQTCYYHVLQQTTEIRGKM